jgi:hypothetical integral membrane protein (TIGR02206 family)
VEGEFHRFGVVHFLVLSTVPAAAALLAAFTRHRAEWRVAVGISLGLLLLALEGGWFLWLVLKHSWDVYYGLPLQLTDATILLNSYIALTRNQSAFDVTYYWSLTALPLAMITPDVAEAFQDIFTIVFFAAHGLAVTITLFLLWSGTMRPRPGSFGRSLLALNAFAAFVFVFNAAFDTNYMYLMTKPEQPSPLDYMGPWPIYILAGEVLAILMFWLLSLPYRRHR